MKYPILFAVVAIVVGLPCHVWAAPAYDPCSSGVAGDQKSPDDTCAEALCHLDGTAFPLEKAYCMCNYMSQWIPDEIAMDYCDSHPVEQATPVPVWNLAAQPSPSPQATPYPQQTPTRVLSGY